MTETFYEHPILNSPYEEPTRYHALDEHGQPTDNPPIAGRRRSERISPVPKSKKQRAKPDLVRSTIELPRARAVVRQASQKPLELSDRVEEREGRISIGTMHLAKGLEFKAVVVMACDDDILLLQDRIETVADEAELDEVYETERHLFYVACTRARDRLLVSGVEPASEFFADLLTKIEGTA